MANPQWPIILLTLLLLIQAYSIVLITVYGKSYYFNRLLINWYLKLKFSIKYLLLPLVGQHFEQKKQFFKAFKQVYFI